MRGRTFFVVGECDFATIIERVISRSAAWGGGGVSIANFLRGRRGRWPTSVRAVARRAVLRSVRFGRPRISSIREGLAARFGLPPERRPRQGRQVIVRGPCWIRKGILQYQKRQVFCPPPCSRAGRPRGPVITVLSARDLADAKFRGLGFCARGAVTAHSLRSRSARASTPASPNWGSRRTET